MNILIVFGSKRGGTAGLARMLADALAQHGFNVTVYPARDVHEVAGCNAVIVAGALYMNRWHRDARRFIRRFDRALRTLPVWLVSSGPLDNSASEREIPPTSQVSKLAARVQASGHETFGGRLSPHATGFPANISTLRSRRPSD